LVDSVEKYLNNNFSHRWTQMNADERRLKPGIWQQIISICGYKVNMTDKTLELPVIL